MAAKKRQSDQEKLKIAIAGLELIFDTARHEELFSQQKIVHIADHAARFLLRLGKPACFELLNQQLSFSLSETAGAPARELET